MRVLIIESGCQWEHEIAIWETGANVVRIGLIVYNLTGRTHAGLRVYERAC